MLDSQGLARGEGRGFISPQPLSIDGCSVVSIQNSWGLGPDVRSLSDRISYLGYGLYPTPICQLVRVQIYCLLLELSVKHRAFLALSAFVLAPAEEPLGALIFWPNERMLLGCSV